ncbi:MAG: septum site-determining protein MinC [Ardenticatenales bacterium]|nr:septum site-determining protein MinC [Ardenticatenales bacterium]
MMNSGPQVSIKGVREGLLVTIAGGDYDNVRQELAQTVAEKGSFLRGSQIILSVGSLSLDTAQVAAMQAIFAAEKMEVWGILTESEATKEAARELGLATRLSGSQTDLDGKALTGEDEPVVANNAGNYALVLRETLRSGRAITHNGHVVIVGDVNPGAQIIAAGDVMVWGRLRGLVHAGAFGDHGAMICALELSPMQLRIADQIAISPDDGIRRAVPERALIRDGQIVAEPWNRRAAE